MSEKAYDIDRLAEHASGASGVDMLRLLYALAVTQTDLTPAIEYLQGCGHEIDVDELLQVARRAHERPWFASDVMLRAALCEDLNETTATDDLGFDFPSELDISEDEEGAAVWVRAWVRTTLENVGLNELSPQVSAERLDQEVSQLVKANPGYDYYGDIGIAVDVHMADIESAAKEGRPVLNTVSMVLDLIPPGASRKFTTTVSELRNRDGSQVTVLGFAVDSQPAFFARFRQRVDSGHPLSYRVRFDDGFETIAHEDELGP